MASSVSTTPTLYFDEKWKLSKKEGSTRSRSSTTPFIKNSSQRRCAFASKCARLVKEQRARFYIMRRLFWEPPSMEGFRFSFRLWELFLFGIEEEVMVKTPHLLMRFVFYIENVPNLHSLYLSTFLKEKKGAVTVFHGEEVA
ncbi:uncharacterized protein HKW66_Vig0129480 [Vigna angularis]|uniref:Uncharacterized protein n=1 Tax=Phaseolus angularis TaxID=3914 RepID=A0A8T0K2J6_PHAAN|nr:uncharacterized protein HKW66_Vig0129480 [Vigna angularis]